MTDHLHEPIELSRFESDFGWLLLLALQEWCTFGRFAGRRLDDLLFNEFDPADAADSFASFVHRAMDADYPDGTMPFPPHHDIQWPLLIIQTAIYTHRPKLIAAMLDEQVREEIDLDDDWQNADGNAVSRPVDYEASILSLPSEWLRLFEKEMPAA